jgi:cysteine-rich repeat protein
MNGRTAGMDDCKWAHICARLGVTLPLLGLLTLNQCGAPEGKRVAVEAGPGAGSTGSLIGGNGGSGSTSASGNRPGQGATSSMASGNAPGSPGTGSTGSGATNSGSIGGGQLPLAGPGEACSVTGKNACVGASQKQRLVCLDGAWEPGTACSPTENCDQLSGDCVAIPADCVGQSVGFRFCDPGGQIGVCGLDLVRVETEECDGTCTAGRCKPLGCGDGVVTPPEECDDGNLSDTDDCTSECQSAGCGDGILQTGEECDDGNKVNTDGCAECKMGRCGDTFVQSGEACDDGNTVDADGCTNKCQMPGCGDNILQTGEECDDGNTLDNDMCTNACKRPKCGDRIIQMGEACDDGNTVNDDACSNLCSVPGCPDNIKQMSEECDDGNMNNTDGCTAACKLPKCGDSFTQVGEDCDDGNMVNDDGCTNMCKRPKCGDNITQRPTEECDDGNTNDLDACSNSCKPKRCGDNVTQEGETCDDGNQNNTDACKNDCQKATCGDSLKSDGEGCDDGNKNNGDGCNSSCQFEPRCGDRVVNNSEQCDDGNTNNGDGCNSSCQNEQNCSNGKKEGTEQCDDGNRNDTDFCRNDCKTVPALSQLNSSCSNTDAIPQTLCMKAAKGWCEVFGQGQVAAGIISGRRANNEYTLGCPNNMRRTIEVATSTLNGMCGGGQQQSPACRSAALRACRDQNGGSTSDKIGFFVSGDNSKTTIACGPGDGQLKEVKPSDVDGCRDVIDNPSSPEGKFANLNSPVKIECITGLTARCPSGTAGMFAKTEPSAHEAGVQPLAFQYTCVPLGPSGVAKLNP